MHDVTRGLEKVREAGGFDLDAWNPKGARSAWAAYRRSAGRKSATPLLTHPSDNVKLGKSETPTYGLSLAPSDGSAVGNVCRYATATCKAHCVAYSGKGGMQGVQAGRVLKTRFLIDMPTAFLSLLRHEIERAVAKHGQINVRLNTFSDLRWERFAPELFDIEGVQYYDYTKWPPGSRDPRPRNYHLTYSVTERDSDEEVLRKAQHGPVAVVFDTKRGALLPDEYLGRTVFDGDTTDDRTTDWVGIVIGLRAKGSLVGDETGFVRKG